MKDLSNTVTVGQLSQIPVAAASPTYLQNVPQLPQSKTNDKEKHKLTACIKKEINHLNFEIIKPII